MASSFSLWDFPVEVRCGLYPQPRMMLIFGYFFYNNSVCSFYQGRLGLSYPSPLVMTRDKARLSILMSVEELMSVARSTTRRVLGKPWLRRDGLPYVMVSKTGSMSAPIGNICPHTYKMDE